MLREPTKLRMTTPPHTSAKARRTRLLADWDRRFLWHPFTQMREWEREEPVIIARGKGPYLVDTRGRRYLDGISSIWVNIHGHRHPVLDRALRRQLGHIAHSSFLGLTNPPAIELARALIRVAPRGLTRVFYSDDGSTAMEVALKMAIQYWQQRKPNAPDKRTFVHLTLAYHGDTVGGMSVGGPGLFQDRFRSLCFPSAEIDAPYCYRCPLKLTYPSCQMACLEPLERLLRARQREIAGVVIEPLVQAVAGMVTAPPGYLTRVRALCTRYKVLLIADEVATGFGRTGRLFACDHEGVTPDLMAISKGLTGGYLPLGATLTTEDVYRAFLGEYGEWKTFFHGHSYTGNPLGCAVALASLKLFRQERTLSRVKRGERLLRQGLAPLARRPHVGDIRRRGYMVGIELVQDKITKTPYPLVDRMGHAVAMEARRRGLLIRPIGNIVILMPPLSTPEKELARMVSIVQESIVAVTEKKSKTPASQTPSPSRGGRGSG